MTVIAREQLNRQNRHILDAMRGAGATATSLMTSGFTVLSVECHGRNPVIWIEPPKAFAVPMQSAIKVRRHRMEGKRAVPETIRVLAVDGCQVQWFDPEPGQAAEA